MQNGVKSAMAELVVCKTPLHTAPPLTSAPKTEIVLKAGDGSVQRVVVRQQHLSITMESGVTIQGRQVRSIATTPREGTITGAWTVRKT
jgi:hypothetical protein